MRQNRKITDELIEVTRQTIDGMTDMKEATNLSRRFSDTQPAIASFILAGTEEISDDATELAYYTGLLLWQCFEKSSATPLREVSVEEVEAFYEKLDTELAALQGVDERIIERRILHSEDFTEPGILRCIVETIYEPDAKSEASLTPDEQGQLFIILRVVADALDASTSSPML